jgi:DNA-directed RNA polymerase subunit RPC12/RpoP
VPYPKDGEADEDWYKKRLSFWGTKWDVEAEVCSKPGSIPLCYHFQSAWSPPIEAFVAISRNYPTLKFILEYDEPGMCFWGIATFINGVVDDKEGQYTDGVCVHCGCENSIGNPERDYECMECGSSHIVTVAEYKKLMKKGKK